MFGLTSQLRRASASVEANLAEGFGRLGPKDFLYFTRMADGSLQETKSFLRLALDLGYWKASDHAELRGLADRAGILLGGFQKYLRSRVADQ